MERVCKSTIVFLHAPPPLAQSLGNFGCGESEPVPIPARLYYPSPSPERIFDWLTTISKIALPAGARQRQVEHIHVYDGGVTSEDISTSTIRHNDRAASPDTSLPQLAGAVGTILTAVKMAILLSTSGN
jgi:hypothetical protein